MRCPFVPESCGPNAIVLVTRVGAAPQVDGESAVMLVLTVRTTSRAFVMVWNGALIVPGFASLPSGETKYPVSVPPAPAVAPLPPAPLPVAPPALPVAPPAAGAPPVPPLTAPPVPATAASVGAPASSCPETPAVPPACGCDDA